MANLMAKRTEPNGLLFLGELLSNGRDFKPKMDELVSKKIPHFLLVNELLKYF